MGFSEGSLFVALNFRAYKQKNTAIALVFTKPHHTIRAFVAMPPNG